MWIEEEIVIVMGNLVILQEIIRIEELWDGKEELIMRTI